MPRGWSAKAPPRRRRSSSAGPCGARPTAAPASSTAMPRSAATISLSARRLRGRRRLSRLAATPCIGSALAGSRTSYELDGRPRLRPRQRGAGRPLRLDRASGNAYRVGRAVLRLARHSTDAHVSFARHDRLPHGRFLRQRVRRPHRRRLPLSPVLGSFGITPYAAVQASASTRRPTRRPACRRRRLRAQLRGQPRRDPHRARRCASTRA